MKIIEGLKGVKDLQRKAEDLRGKIERFSAHLSFETPTYSDQKRQVGEWLQAHGDILKEIENLIVRIQKTNLATNVTIEIGGRQITKPITAWIVRRKDLSLQAKNAWSKLTDRGLKEGQAKQTSGEIMDIKIIRCYDPVERDNMISTYDSEPTLIDVKLEIINAVTDLIE